ncbi:MAG TPA: type II secretion system protein [Candidatus Microsaccharimonas sp.]|jgi:prepilin-type N-terminal cleavage/methylation domain-containing protein
MNAPQFKQTRKQGFTIIEVVLVLAIAGLIFLMVFIALPALQRNQRDTQRKNDMGRLSTALVNYTNSNRGTLPTNYTTFTTQYLITGGDTFIDPAGAPSGSNATSYQFTALDNQELTKSYSESQNTIYYTTGYACGDTSSTVVTGGSRKVAFRMALEGGGYYCVSN